MELWLHMLQNSLIGTMAIFLIFIFYKLKKRYRYTHKKYIWILISIWLIIPFSFFQGSNKIALLIPQVYVGRVGNEAGNTAVNGTINPAANPEESNDFNDTVLYDNDIKKVKYENSQKGLIYNLTFDIWICGVVLLLLYLGLSYGLSYRYIVCHRRKCDNENILQTLNSISGLYKIKRIPQLYLLNDINISPFTIGIIHKKIYLPDKKYMENDLQYIISHEIVHCKERDTYTKFLAMLAKVIHWFNPFVWLMVKCVEQDIELSCDEIVLEKKSMIERKEYSEIIMSFIHSERLKKFYFSSGYLNNTKFIKRRFQNIYNTENKTSGFIRCVCFMGCFALFLAAADGCIEIKQKIFTPFVNKIPIDYGFEIRTDIDGDGENERVMVSDNISGTRAFTQLTAKLESGNNPYSFVSVDFEGYWGSYIVSGDISGNGLADIVLVRISTGSTYGGGVVNVLHLEKDKWIPYPSEFIKNPTINLNQPENFREENFDISCLGATIVEDETGVKLRLILPEDLINDTVKCIDCSLKNEGWYIENMEIISNYYGENKEYELLKNNFLK